MKICLAYDDWSSFPPGTDMPEDFGAEFDEEETIQSLLHTIQSAGYMVEPLPVDGDLPDRIKKMRPDMVFNIAEGARGSARESMVPSWLDHAGIPYTGADGLALACSLDKALSKTLVQAHGVRTPPFHLVRKQLDWENCDLTFPVFAKPNAEGSSMGIRRDALIGDVGQLHEHVRWLLEEYQQDCLLEQFAPGREFCVGLLGNQNVKVLPIVEIQTSSNFYSYEDKSKHNKELICPANVSGELKDEMIQMGRDVYSALRCRDLARVDLKLDENDQPTFLEVNPLPGLSPDYSIFPQQAFAGGYSYEKLISRIIDAAVKRNEFKEERSLL